MIASGYSIDLYCDVPAHLHYLPSWSAQFADESSREAWAQARKAGWKVRLVLGQAICPKCAKEGWRFNYRGDEPSIVYDEPATPSRVAEPDGDGR